MPDPILVDPRAIVDDPRTTVEGIVAAMWATADGIPPAPEPAPDGWFARHNGATFDLHGWLAHRVGADEAAQRWAAACRLFDAQGAELEAHLADHTRDVAANVAADRAAGRYTIDAKVAAVLGFTGFTVDDAPHHALITEFGPWDVYPCWRTGPRSWASARRADGVEAWEWALDFDRADDLYTPAVRARIAFIHGFDTWDQLAEVAQCHWHVDGSHYEPPPIPREIIAVVTGTDVQ